MSILCVHIQFGPQSAGRLSPLQNCSGLISSYWEMSGAGADKYDISSISEMTWSPVGATVNGRVPYITLWEGEKEPTSGLKMRDIYPKSGCKCSVGTALRRGTNRNGKARISWRQPCLVGRLGPPVWRFSIGLRKWRRRVADYIGHPMDSWPRFIVETEAQFW